MDIERAVGEVAEEILGPGAVSGRLEADSLALVELALALEERLGIRLPEDASWATFDEVMAAARAADGSTPDRLGSGFGRLQWAAHGVLRAPIRLAYRLVVSGPDRVPPFGPAILASNHDSLLDIPCLVVASPRPVWFMAKVELFRGPLASALLRRFGGFPVRRAASDLRAVRTALDVLRRGRALGMYPEGTRGAYLRPFLPGAAWLALATGAPLVPVGVSGTAEALPRGSRLPRRTHVTVRFGEPIEVGREGDARARLERARAITEDLRSSVELLAR